MATEFGTIKIFGFDELAAKLKELPAKVSAQIVRQALVRSLKPVQQDALSRAPEDTGRLRNFIRIRSTYRNGEVVGFVNVRPLNPKEMKRLGLTSDAYYAKFVEFGTAYQRAQPFLRPAFDAGVEGVLGDMYYEISTAIEKAMF